MNTLLPPTSVQTVNNSWEAAVGGPWKFEMQPVVGDIYWRIVFNGDSMPASDEVGNVLYEGETREFNLLNAQDIIYRGANKPYPVQVAINEIQ